MNSEQIKQVATRIRKLARSYPDFSRSVKSTWEQVARLALEIQASDSHEADTEELIKLAADVLMVEIEVQGLPLKSRKSYRDVVHLCFDNIGVFWDQKPMVHIIAELSWIVETARKESVDPLELLEDKIGCSAMWDVPFQGHF
jgi:hypothetical protein